MPQEKFEQKYERWQQEIKDIFEHVKQQEARFSTQLETPYDCGTFSEWLEALGLVDDISLSSVELDIDSNGGIWFVKRCD